MGSEELLIQLLIKKRMTFFQKLRTIGTVGLKEK